MEINKMRITDEIQCFLEDIKHPAAVIGLDGVIFNANERFMNVFKIEQHWNVKDLISSNSLATWENKLAQIIDQKQAGLNVELAIGENRNAEINVSLTYDEAAYMVIAVFKMPFSYKCNQEEQRESLFRQSDNLLIVCDLDGKIKDINDLTFEFFAIQSNRFVGAKMDEIFKLFSEEESTIKSYKEQVLNDGYGETVQQYIHPSEHIRYYKMTSFIDNQSNLILTKIVDYTEKTLLEKQLADKGSLVEVGQLAASIAHEIRNPITTLKGFTQLLKANANDETLKYLNVIEDEIQRMESILSEMLFLSKPVTHEKKILSLNALLLDILKVIHPKATFENIKIVKKELSTENVMILGDEGKLKQVILNLLKNGLEAMQPGGVLSIGLKKINQKEISLTIEDTGKGMDEMQLKQIFMPYFTTRPEGTGLGLPFVLKTVEDHHGTVSVSSEVGEGTVFNLIFPAVEKKLILTKETKQKMIIK